MEELEPNSQVSKYVIQSAGNNLRGARLVESLLLENSKDKYEGWDFYERPLLHCARFLFTLSLQPPL